ncbi:MAG: biotin--[acetyl-CoA-carboxylase] ligase [Oscillospiraceae bacterium]
MVNSLLKTTGLRLRYVEETGSTNADLLEDGSAASGSVLIAGRQSAGRGRMRRAFASPEGGLYMSVLFRDISAADALQFTPRAAVAVSLAIERSSGRRAYIKWVNDVLLDGLKVCGILAEAVTRRGLDMVLGIGVNVAEPDGGFPEALRGVAGAVFEDPIEFAREKLAAGILNTLFDESLDVYTEYVRRSAVLGRDIAVRRTGAAYEARALEIDRDYRLIIERGGQRETLDSGEVSIRL